MPAPGQSSRGVTFRVDVEVDKTAAAKAQAELNRLRNGGTLASGLTATIGGGPAAGPAGAGAAGVSRVSAFDRPIPVIIVGAKPGVFGPGGMGGGPGGSGAVGGPKDAASKSLEILQNLQLGGIAGRYGQFQAYGQAASGAGFAGAGKLLSKAALPLAIGTAAFGAAGTVADIANDPSSTGPLALRKLFRDLVPFGGAIQGTFDQITGRAAGVEQARLGGQYGRMDVAGYYQTDAARASIDPTQAANVARLGGFRGPTLEPYVNRSTAGGEREFRQKQQLVQLDRETAKYQREAAAATADRAEREKRLRGLQALDVGLRAARGDNDPKPKALPPGGLLGVAAIATNPRPYADSYAATGAGWQSGPGYQRWLEQQGVFGAAISGGAQARVSGLLDLNAAQNREAEARGQLRMQEGKRLQLRAGFAEEDAAVSGNSAVRLGRMNPLQRMAAKQAFDMLQKFGPDNVPDDIKGLADSYAPGEANKVYERSGAQTREFKGGTAAGLDDFRGDPEKLRQQAADLRNQAEKLKVDSERQIAQAAVDAGRDLGQAVARVILQIVSEAKREIEMSLKSARNAAG